MKKIVLSAALLCALSYANAQIKMPAPSPAQTIKQEFGLSNVELSYSRPVKKAGRYLETWCLIMLFGEPVQTELQPLHSATMLLSAAKKFLPANMDFSAYRGNQLDTHHYQTNRCNQSCRLQTGRGCGESNRESKAFSYQCREFQHSV